MLKPASNCQNGRPCAYLMFGYFGPLGEESSMAGKPGLDFLSDTSHRQECKEHRSQNREV